ncbi:MAG TPA: hypothetical protein VIO33_24430 [Burkholderiaceae bacterium]
MAASICARDRMAMSAARRFDCKCNVALATGPRAEPGDAAQGAIAA